jgi:hypothetical protein
MGEHCHLNYYLLTCHSFNNNNIRGEVMLPGIDDPGKHSSAMVLFEHYVSSVEYYYITLASSGSLYLCRWRNVWYHCKVIVGATYRSVVELHERNLLEGVGFKPPPS